MPPPPIVAQNLTVVELDADDDTSQDAADLVSQESKDQDDKSKSPMKNNEQALSPPAAVEPIDAFVHVIGHPDRHGDTEKESPKSSSLKENMDIIDKPLKPLHNEDLEIVER